MLKQPAEFPHPGSRAFVSPHAEEVTILQRIQTPGVPDAYMIRRDLPGASGTFRAEAETIHATLEAALGKKPAKRRRAA